MNFAAAKFYFLLLLLTVFSGDHAKALNLNPTSAFVQIENLDRPDPMGPFLNTHTFGSNSLPWDPDAFANNLYPEHIFFKWFIHVQNNFMFPVILHEVSFKLFEDDAVFDDFIKPIVLATPPIKLLPGQILSNPPEATSTKQKLTPAEINATFDVINTNLEFIIKDVTVTAKPHDVPGPLPLLGVGAMISASRKLRRKTKQSKNLD
jgi:hypothetical protein